MATKRITVYFDPDLHRALRVKALEALRLPEEPHIRKILEVFVLGPDYPIDRKSRRVDDAVGQGQLVIDTRLGGNQGQIGVEVDHSALLHQRSGLQRVPIAAVISIRSPPEHPR